MRHTDEHKVSSVHNNNKKEEGKGEENSVLASMLLSMYCLLSVPFSNPGGRSPMHQGSQDGSMVSIFCCC